MGLWSIIVPQETTNYVTNPSVEREGGYVATAAAVSRSLAQSLFGRSSAYVTFAGGALSDLVAFSLETLPNGPHFASAYVKGTLPSSWSWSLSGVGGAFLAPVLLEDLGEWKRYGVAFAAGQSVGATQLRIVSNAACAFYVDGIQVEPGATVTTYCDGSQPGCEWLGAPLRSASFRPALEKRGGTVIDLETVGLDVLAASGIGEITVEHAVGERAGGVGTYFAGRRTLPRTITLDVQMLGGSFLRVGLHQTRKAVLAVIRESRGPDAQPVTLIYRGANATKPLLIDAAYDGGLEYEPNDTGSYERVTVRFVAYDPFFRTWGEKAHQITALQRTITGAVFVRDRNGWAGTPALYGEVRALKRGPDGEIYVGGVIPSLGHVARLHDASWLSLDGGVSVDLGSPSVNALVFTPDGRLFIGGEFSWAGTPQVSTLRVAEWNGTQFLALGSGLNGNVVYALALTPDGRLIAGGDLQDGELNVLGAMEWDGATWERVSSQELNEGVRALIVGRDGRLYAGGGFWDDGSGDYAPANFIASLDLQPTSQYALPSWYQVGDLIDGTVDQLAQDARGRVYAAGPYSSQAGGSMASNVVAWNGSTWKHVSRGVMQGEVDGMAVLDNGELNVAGFVWLYGRWPHEGSRSRLMAFNGSAWFERDFYPTDNVGITALSADGNRLLVGMAAHTEATVSAQTMIDWAGPVPVQPTITVEHSDATVAAPVLRFLRNETTGKQIPLFYPMQRGETVTLDLRRGAFVSSLYGPRLSAVSPSADWDFSLVPGRNVISVLATHGEEEGVSLHLTAPVLYGAADDAA